MGTSVTAMVVCGWRLEDIVEKLPPVEYIEDLEEIPGGLSLIADFGPGAYYGKILASGGDDADSVGEFSSELDKFWHFRHRGASNYPPNGCSLYAANKKKTSEKFANRPCNGR